MPFYGTPECVMIGSLILAPSLVLFSFVWFAVSKFDVMAFVLSYNLLCFVVIS